MSGRRWQRVARGRGAGRRRGRPMPSHAAPVCLAPLLLLRALTAPSLTPPACRCIPTAAYLSIHNMARPGLLVVLCCGGHSLGSGQGLPIHTDLGLGSEFACASLCRLRHAGRVWPAAGANRPAAWYPSGPSAQPPHLYPSSQVASVIDKWGSQHLRGEYLPALTAMEARASYCLTEPGRRAGWEDGGRPITPRPAAGCCCMWAGLCEWRSRPPHVCPPCHVC